MTKSNLEGMNGGDKEKQGTGEKEIKENDSIITITLIHTLKCKKEMQK
jgi:hypothetical protein